MSPLTILMYVECNQKQNYQGSSQRKGKGNLPTGFVTKEQVTSYPM